jgi:hypothetical protein
MTQAVMDFSAPAPPTVYQAHAAECAAELARHDGSRERVLARLQQGEATNLELAAICLRFGARILELRRAGYPITAEPAGRGVWLYRLTGGAA